MKSGKLARFNLRALDAALASAVALVGAGFGIDAYAANATGTANATVVTPIAITAVDPLRFGAFSTDAAAQTVTITPAGGRSGTVTRLVAAGNAGAPAFGAGTFTVAGDTAFNLTYAITLPGNGVVSISTGIGGAGRTMAVDSFTSNPSGTGALTTGSQALSVGATLTTVASQITGAYTGTYTVTVEYN